MEENSKLGREKKYTGNEGYDNPLIDVMKPSFFRSITFNTTNCMNQTDANIIGMEHKDNTNIQMKAIAEEIEIDPTKPYFYKGGGIPGVAVDAKLVEQQKYTGHTKCGLLVIRICDCQLPLVIEYLILIIMIILVSSQKALLGKSNTSWK